MNKKSQLNPSDSSNSTSNSSSSDSKSSKTKKFLDITPAQIKKHKQAVSNKKYAIKTSLIVILAFIVLAFLFYFAIILLNTENSTRQEIQPNPITKIIDGDTLELNNGEIVRLLCVDTPEKSDAGYEDALTHLAFLLLGDDKNIIIERASLDHYNRTLAWVYSNDILVNKEIVDNSFGELFVYNNSNCTRMK